MREHHIDSHRTSTMKFIASLILLAAINSFNNKRNVRTRFCARIALCVFIKLAHSSIQNKIFSFFAHSYYVQILNSIEFSIGFCPLFSAPRRILIFFALFASLPSLDVLFLFGVASISFVRVENVVIASRNSGPFRVAEPWILCRAVATRFHIPSVRDVRRLRLEWQCALVR